MSSAGESHVYDFTGETPVFTNHVSVYQTPEELLLIDFRTIAPLVYKQSEPAEEELTETEKRSLLPITPNMKEIKPHTRIFLQKDHAEHLRRLLAAFLDDVADE